MLLIIIIRKLKPMETTPTNGGNFYDNLVSFIKQKEGGLSNDPTDSASKYPSPTPEKYHTNKGVTYKTFVDSSSSLNYLPTAENFINLSNDIWGRIFKQKYYNKALLITSNPILAGYLAYWYWQGYDSKLLPFKLVLDVIHSNQSNKSKLAALVNLRKIYFNEVASKYPKNKKYLKGWLNTATDFYNRFNSYL